MADAKNSGRRRATLPCPSWPSMPRPQAHTVPPENRKGKPQINSLKKNRLKKPDANCLKNHVEKIWWMVGLETKKKQKSSMLIHENIDYFFLHSNKRSHYPLSPFSSDIQNEPRNYLSAQHSSTRSGKGNGQFQNTNGQVFADPAPYNSAAHRRPPPCLHIYKKKSSLKKGWSRAHVVGKH